jgi:hypothetical protein
MLGIAARVAQPLRDLQGIGRGADQGPGHQGDELAVCPGERDEADPAMVAARDRLQKARVEHGRGHALELKPLVGRVDRARHVDGGDQIGIGRVLRRCGPDQERQQDYREQTACNHDASRISGGQAPSILRKRRDQGLI